MEKQTRINKYKELREEMKEEVGIDRQIKPEKDEEEDDFLSFLPKNEKKNIDDTLMEPLSYETLDQNNEEVKMALNEAKVKIGKEQYNTRLDILNKIKQEEYTPRHEEISEPVSRRVHEEPEKKMSLLEKLASMSPEEDVKELEKYEQDLTVSELMKENKKHKKIQKVQKEKPVEEENVDDYEEEEEESDSKLVTILNYVIIVFIIIFIVLAFFIVKQLLF